jgi:hypothetical protein
MTVVIAIVAATVYVLIAVWSTRLTLDRAVRSYPNLDLTLGDIVFHAVVAGLFWPVGLPTFLFSWPDPDAKPRDYARVAHWATSRRSLTKRMKSANVSLEKGKKG